MSEGKRAVESVEDLITALSLKDIQYTDLHAKRGNAPGVRPRDVSGSIRHEISYGHSDDGLEGIAEIKATAERGETSLSVTVAAHYEFSEPIAELSEDIAREFVNRVVLFQLTPFIREGLASLASRLRVPAPVLGLLKSTEATGPAEAHAEEGGGSSEPASPSAE